MNLTQTMNDVLSVLDKIQGLPAAGLLFIGCIALGYALRFWVWFPNKMIPVAVTMMPAILLPIIADPKVATIPFRVWLVKNVLIGVIIGAAAWMLHFLVIRRIENLIAAKFGNGKSDTTFFNKPVDPNKPSDKPVNPT